MKNLKVSESVLKVVVIGAAALVVSACASLGMGKPEDVVGKRAIDFWNARITGDIPKAYSYLNKAYKETVTEKHYGRQYAGTMAQGVELVSVKCEPERCVVGVNLKVQPMIPGQKLGTIDVYSKQTWLLEDGQWRLYLEP